MEKIQLVVLGLTASPASNNAYALILKELEGNKRLPIIIGAFEAQAIALEMEGVVPPRPMTHDLIKSLIESFNSSITEVFISELRDGTYYAKLIFEDIGLELDARPSDAIAIAVRCNSPIYVNAEVLSEAGIVTQNDESEADDIDTDNDLNFPQPEKKKSNKPLTKTDQIQQQLDKAILDEDYEKAATLRDELKKLLESS
jgi:bifunctional DNase/RNase